MNIISINSSSEGNAHLIESGGFHLLLDCGVPLSRIREALDYKLENVVGCLVSHLHGDHASGLPQLERETSIPIYCTEGTLKRFELSGRYQRIDHKVVFNCGPEFQVVPFELEHDKEPFCECFGFMVCNRTRQRYQKRLLYITDAGFVPENYRFPHIHYLMIEANYSFDRLVDSEVNAAARKRIAETHLSISQVCEFVSRHPDLKEIHLLHLSDGHSDAMEFKRMVQDIAAVPVYIAGK